jgi:hypothetical protein
LATAATGKQARQGLLSFNTTEETGKTLEMSGKIRVGKEGKVLFSRHMSREERANRGFDMVPSNYSNKVRREVYSRGKEAVNERFGKLADGSLMDVPRIMEGGGSESSDRRWRNREGNERRREEGTVGYRMAEGRAPGVRPRD